jgi:hypothetical protein
MENDRTLHISTIEWKRNEFRVGSVGYHTLKNEVAAPVYKTVTVDCKAFYVKDGALIIIKYNKKGKLIKTGYSLSHITKWDEV